MYYLKSIIIEGMWGNRTVKTNFNQDVNIFIGYNGTGKTTFLNIITGILSVDLNKLLHNRFKKAKILLFSKNKNAQKQKTIVVSMNNNEITYKISNVLFHIPIRNQTWDIGIEYYPRKMMMVQNMAVEKVSEAMKEICSISGISVHRELHKGERFRNLDHGEEKFIPLVDRKLNEVSQDLFVFKRQLDSDVNDVFLQFQQNMLTTMLYDEKFDTLENMGKINYPLDKLQEGLLRAYKNVGLTSDSISQKIKKHISKIAHSLQVKEELNKSVERKKWAANDAFPLTAYHRTIYIVEQLNKAEEQKSRILLLWNLFLDKFKSFCEKEIFLDNSSKSIHINNNGGNIDLVDLSSGEKQLFILLSEMLLKNNQSVISITDEPELSLHISWQQKILPALHELNTTCQIIVATHSPEIAGSYPEKIIKMEDILS